MTEAGTQTLTNKTLTSPTINAFSGTGNGSIQVIQHYPVSLDLSATRGVLIETTGNLASADVTLLRASALTSGQYGFDIKYMGSVVVIIILLHLKCTTQPGTNVEAITVLQDGKVGINNTSPGQALDVTGSM